MQQLEKIVQFVKAGENDKAITEFKTLKRKDKDSFIHHLDIKAWQTGINDKVLDLLSKRVPI